MIRIALVDDDPSFAATLALALEAQGFAVETHRDGMAALEAFERRRPDLAVLDVIMPRLDGMDLLRRLRQISTLPVIMLSGMSEEVDEMLGLRLGADDYVAKPVSARLLAERIRAVLRRGATAEDPPALVRGPLAMDPDRHAASWQGREIALTATEFMLLRALAQRPGVVRTRAQLMDAAYDSHIHVDDRTIDSHIKRVRRKLRGVDPGFGAIETLYGVGYRFNAA